MKAASSSVLNAMPAILRRKVYEGDLTICLMELADGRTVNVSQSNYIARMSREFFDADMEYQMVWSRTSGEIICA